MPNFYTNFKCPKCRGYKFGTYFDENAVIRHCHSGNCNYSAPESDDHLHFTHISDEYGNEKLITDLKG